MNLMKTSRTLAAIAFATLGFAFPAQATVTAFFSATSNCLSPLGANPLSFSTGGPAVPVSLCMSTTTEASCGHTVVLQSAVGESGNFVVTSSTLGAAFSDPNSTVAQLPLAINNPPIIADLGGTGSAPAPAGANQLLTTFALAPQASATNNTYVLSLNSVSIAAIDLDGTCGTTMVPGEAAISASLTMGRSAAPVFTSASSATFSTASANTFNVTATGVPTPTITAGALPAGVSFVSGGANSGTGTLSTANGTFTAGTITFTATSGAASQPQTFTLSASGLASQTITLSNPGTQTFSATPITLAASASSGLPVTLSSITPFVCAVSGVTVTMTTTGQCTVAANQAGNATVAAAPQVTQSFGITAAVPGAPTIGTGTPGNAKAIVAFTPPASNGGSPILSYTATCSSVSSGTFSASGGSSPIAVSGLTNSPASPYNCSVTATNSIGTGAASAVVAVTPTAGAPLTLLSVQSRKTHGGAGVFDLPIVLGQPLTAPTVEPRQSLAAGHTIVFQFNNAVATPGTVGTVDSAAVTGIGAPSASASGTTEVIVTLTGAVLDNKRLTINLTDTDGQVGVNATVNIGFLVGDVTNSRTTTSADIIQVQARSGQATNSGNFVYDVTVNGSISSADIVQVKARSGTSLAP